MKTFRIKLYEIIGDGGWYFPVTRKADSAEKAIAAMREVYPSNVFRLAEVVEVKS